MKNKWSDCELGLGDGACKSESPICFCPLHKAAPALLEAARCMWAGVPDKDREEIDSGDPNKIVTVFALRKGLEKLRAAIAAAAEGGGE